MFPGEALILESTSRLPLVGIILLTSVSTKDFELGYFAQVLLWRKKYVRAFFPNKKIYIFCTNCKHFQILPFILIF